MGTACNRISCRAKLTPHGGKSLHYDKTKSAAKISVLRQKHPVCGEKSVSYCKKSVSCDGKIWFYAGENRAKVTFLRPERPFFAKQAARARIYAGKRFFVRPKKISHAQKNILERSGKKNLICEKNFSRIRKYFFAYRKIFFGTCEKVFWTQDFTLKRRQRKIMEYGSTYR